MILQTADRPATPARHGAHVGHVRPRQPPAARSMAGAEVRILPSCYSGAAQCATELLDRTIAAGQGERHALVTPAELELRRLLETVNRIAHVLVDDLGLVPGNRVLLRAPTRR